jgi:3-deoxy-D-manno-octulosonic acid kinase
VFAPLTGDRFLVPTRAPREAAASLALEARGIDTPEVLAYALYPAGPGLRRVDVCTRFVPDSWDFGAVLAGLAPRIERGAAERAVLDLLVRLARAGVVHPDLNVKNILLVPDGGSGAPRAWLLDVDVVQFRSAPTPQLMHRNVGRLVRSIRKWHRRHDLPLDDAWLTGFVSSALGALP